MATVTLKTGAVYAVGSTVGAYPLSQFPAGQLPWSGALPSGAASVATAVVAADSSYSFTGLADGTDYYAYSATGGRYVRFYTPPVVALLQGSGDLLSIYSPSPVPTGKFSDVRDGSSGSPLTGALPTLKISRTASIARATVEAIGGVGTDGAEQVASILGISKALTTNDVQTVGVMGVALTNSTTGVQGNDACGLYGIGRASGASTNGTAIGGFITARRDVSSARANALELNCQNYTATAGTFNTSGFSDTTGLWLNAHGTSDSGVGIAFGNAFGRQFDIGIGFTSQNTVGSPKTASIQDESQSATSILVKGTHATAAIAVTSGSGAIVVGATTPNATDLPLLEAVTSTTNVALIRAGSASGSAAVGIKAANTNGSTALFVSGGIGNVLTGTVAGDTGIRFSASKVFHIGRDGNSGSMLLGAGVGFNGTAPVAKPTLAVAATDLATVITLANDLRTRLINYGLAA